MSWAEDRAEAKEQYTESRVDAEKDHRYYGGTNREAIEQAQFDGEVGWLRLTRDLRAARGW